MTAVRALLLDLDGTLADTAADLGGALNALRVEEGLPPLPAEQIRPVASDGARGLLDLGFGLKPDQAEFQPLRERFLQSYSARIAVDTRLFAGMEALLLAMADAGLPWGVVTNKPGYLTDPLLEALAIQPPAACVVSGDTVAQAKPHPAPLLHAASQLDCPPEACLYVGDAVRDIQAARAAGMPVVVAGWGYLPGDGSEQDWGGDAVFPTPDALLSWLSPRLSSSHRQAVSD